MIYGHGDDKYRYGERVRMNFSSNIPGFADLSPLKTHLAAHLDTIASYPEPEPFSLEALIAGRLGLQPKAVMVTAGVTEAIYLIAQLYRGYTSIIPQPTYSEYEDACKMNGHTVSYSMDEELERLPDKRLYWLCTPNNPTGTVMGKDAVSDMVRHHQRSTFIIDQSYEAYTSRGVLRATELADCHNVILLHSLTKRYCIPGLRIGYITASPAILQQLRLLRKPWTVSSIAQEAARFVIESGFQPIVDRKAYLDEARRLHAELSQVDGVRMMDSDTHFMVGCMEGTEARQLKQWLLENHGILVRDASNFHGLRPGHFRVCAQTPEENDTLVAAVRAYREMRQDKAGSQGKAHP